MLKTLSKFPEYKILAYLGIIALSWYLFTIASSLLSWLADIFLLIFFAWTLALIIEPLVLYIQKRHVSKTIASAAVYFGIALLTVFIIMSITPTIIIQLQKLSTTIPQLLPNISFSARLETFIENSLGNSVLIVSQIASAISGVFLVFILSFYFLISKKQIISFLARIIPNQFEEDFFFLEKTLNQTFASFIRIQVALGFMMGIATFLTLSILGVEFALTTSIFAGFLASIPVIGSIIFLVPSILASLTYSVQKTAITAIILILLSQLVYNVIGPKLLGKALKIHPIVVILSFVIGFKIAGFWGAILSVPIASSIAIVTKEFMKYWQIEADKNK